MIHPGSPAGGRRLRFDGAGKAIVPFALAAFFAASSNVQAATCVPTAEAVRKANPSAWPKWTYGPSGERCWYSGTKPVFARAPLQLVPDKRPAPRPPQAAAPAATVRAQADARSESPMPQPWMLEHRWADVFKYPDPPPR
jgi:hypothetical protein